VITIDTLRTAGLSDAQIVRVLQVEQQERLTRVREHNRNRQQRHRQRNGVTRDHRDQRDVRDTLSISSSWIPKEETRKKILGGGVSEVDFVNGLDRFRNHYSATGATFVNPDAKLLNWFSNPLQTKGQVNGRQTSTLMDAFDQLIAGAESEVAGDSTLRDVSPGGYEGRQAAFGVLPTRKTP
jgi:hypothetical protein